MQLKGAIATTGTNAVPFVLPKPFRPETNVYVAVNLCDGTNGRLWIQPNGTVTVQAGGPSPTRSASRRSMAHGTPRIPPAIMPSR